MLTVEPTTIPDVKVITPDRFGDHRGFFSETYNKQQFAEAGIEIDFVQDNHSMSAAVGTVRGLHFQSAPFAQDKLIRVVRGRILDVAVDIRRSSPTYGKHVAIELSAENGRQLLVPIGFAHGFCTLEPNTEIQYKVSNYYSSANDHGILWNDPILAIAWPVKPDQVTLSDKDRRQMTLAELINYFD
ncbi:dTDP-4-dehydrorhamnose 3,5-epimerase [Microvirga sp. HBU67558]|uniref:dTDP-4-dehydrorhamnose 3,5-epimerase n=1 Tax=Microvirga TaxID=186650 RepID=UPI001B38FAB8|nr:dTDP-4-dehydrorhamnose 3,5-epimerase [Microvirga sp. HBU67655]MBQ0823548.1 dTDP-4-dehydrorhamnose 3,5-epimerase [Microvirga sp. HBU67558]